MVPFQVFVGLTLFLAFYITLAACLCLYETKIAIPV